MCAVHSFIDKMAEVIVSLWTPWLILPFLMAFLLPLTIILLLYVTAAILYIYDFYRLIMKVGLENDTYEAPLKVISGVWSVCSYIWHGYEVKGMENIPEKSPALIIYYHGAVPIDLYYFMAKVHLAKNRIIHNVADRFLFKFPGFSMIAKAYKVQPGSLDSCSSDLKANNLLAISPGGVYEALLSDSTYCLLWKKRVGFAKVALDAKVPIIPVYTQNVREAFRSMEIFHNFALKLYSLTKFPLTPIYGGLPVKLTTHVGAPIPYDGSLTPEELAVRVANALRELIAKDQCIPGNMMQALLDRFYEPPSKDKVK